MDKILGRMAATMACDEMDKIGPYEPNSIVTGECSELMAALPDGCIDLTVTSPPYDNLRVYNGFVFPFERIAQQLYRVTKPGGVVVWVVGDATIDGSETLTSFTQALYFRGLGFNVETMIYQKVAGATGSNYYYWQAFEYTFILSKGRPKSVHLIADRKNVTLPRIRTESAGHRHQDNSKKGRRVIERKEYGIRSNIWSYNAGVVLDNLATDHPAIFPEALARDHILSWSNPGDIVLDPMCGSGTTLKMAVVTGRQYLGFDISPEYCDLARRRVGEVEREQRREWKQIRDNGKLDDLPMFQLYQE